MKKYFKHPLTLLFARHLAAFVSIILSTLILKLFEDFLEIQVIALIYLLPVMISTVFWGLTPGIFAGFFAFLAFNYFFIPPYYTLLIHKTQDLITLIIFLIVAVVISQLIGQSRAGMKLAQSHEWEATRMYELTSTLAGLQDITEIARALANHTLETFYFDRVEISIKNEKDEPALIISAPAEMISHDPPSQNLPLRTARSQEGSLKIWHHHGLMSSEENRLLDAFISQGALSLERIRLAKGEHKARVLEESDHLKSSLLNSVSHELRSPLAAIKASVSSLRSGTVDWNVAARQELLITIEEETDHLNLLVGNLLDMSRIESGVLKPQRKWNSMTEIAMGVVSKMRKQLENHHLEIDLPQDLPLIPTDYVMIEQVFTNLLSNSIKYTSSGTVIGISARKEIDCLHTQVTNQSPPVPEEHLQRIFEKFHRITEADRVTGTGLGLSICKGIVEAHGGKIWAENLPSCFVFHFKLPLTVDGTFPDIPKEVDNG